MKFPLVYIIWIDAAGSRDRMGAWHDLDEVVGLADRAHVCHSVGWLIQDGDNVKRLVQNLQDEDDEIGAVPACFSDVCITTEQLVFMQELKVPKRSKRQ